MEIKSTHADLNSHLQHLLRQKDCQACCHRHLEVSWLPKDHDRRSLSPLVSCPELFWIQRRLLRILSLQDSRCVDCPFNSPPIARDDTEQVKDYLTTRHPGSCFRRWRFIDTRARSWYGVERDMNFGRFFEMVRLIAR